VGRGAKVAGGAGARFENAEELVLFGQLGVRLRDVRGRPRDERGTCMERKREARSSFVVETRFGEAPGEGQTGRRFD
tara:strand:+ start:79 stop:309 length:231 start_codon:yes stop_codon:yes gene_type:complete